MKQETTQDDNLRVDGTEFCREWITNVKFGKTASHPRPVGVISGHQQFDVRLHQAMAGRPLSRFVGPNE